MPKGTLAVISAPSGTGKSTIARKLLQKRKDLRCSVSCTTRSPRHGERHGKHYFFLTREEFKKKIQGNYFLEWAMVHDEYYGTPRQFIEAQIKAGHQVLLAIDVQGAAAVRRKIPDSILVFLAPPSLESLRDRLAARREDAESASKRLANSRGELAAVKEFDYFVINDNLEQAVAQVESILTAESLKVSRQEFPDFVTAGSRL
ncbi:MAG: guanylate kinase [Elusimicrobia bacterium]|nr:guanylate kinase [Elusimicrobiota bacterium]